MENSLHVIYFQNRNLSHAMIGTALMTGWRLFNATRAVSVTYAMLFAVIGLMILSGIERASVAPMMLPLAGGFMLVAPVLLCGFFAIADVATMRCTVTLLLPVAGFRNVSREVIALGLVCTLLFLIWITDAATLYGFMVGRDAQTLMAIIPPPENVRLFMFWSSLMGASLAFVIFCISAFSLPLLYYRRVSLVRAVVLSVRTVFSNISAAISWALILAVSTIGSIFFLPLFLIVFPVLAYASHALYRELFPVEAT